MLKIYCDGACSGNPGPGGWAFVIPQLNIEQSGYEVDTTNNRMEITAAYKALEYLYKHLINLGEAVEIITDSQYVINTMTQGWKKNKNQDLWAYIDEYNYYFTDIKWTWVKGHASNEYNNRCDELAVSEYKKYQNYNKKLSEEIAKNDINRYGEMMPINLNQKIDIRFTPYERYNLGNNRYIQIFKCTALDNVYAAELNSKELLYIGNYDGCKNVIAHYNQLSNSDFKEIVG